MSVIAGLQDFRQEAPPADIGVYHFPAAIIVFKYTFAGTTYVCAVRSGERGWVLVDFGTDAATVINSAINALTAGGKIFVMAGSYTISSVILIQGKNGIILEGEGWRSTKLVVSGADTICIKIGHRTDANLTSKDIIVRGFYIDGSSQTTETTTPESVDRRFGIEVASPAQQTEGVIIEENYLYNTGSDSIYGYNAGDCTVRNNIVEATRGYWAAIHSHTVSGSNPYAYDPWKIIGNHLIGPMTTHNVIRHGKFIGYNSFYNCNNSEGVLMDSRGSIVVGNYFRSAATSFRGVVSWEGRSIIIGNTFWVESSLNEAIYISQQNNVAIIGNIISEWTGTSIPIHLDRANGCLVLANQIVNSAGWGIDLEGSSRNVVADNVLKNIGTGTNNTCDAIRLRAYGTTYSTRNIIEDNQIFSDASNLPRYGINEADTNEDYNIIFGNVIANVATAAINKQGVNTICKFNPGYPTETLLKTGLAPTIGTGDTYGPATTVTSLSGIIELFKLAITIGGTFGTGETVTVKVETVWDDGSTLSIEKSYTAVSSKTWLTDSEVQSLWKDGNALRKINLYAKTNLSSTTVTVSIDVMAST